jgi:CheY-like chemotaxis protein
MPNKTVLIVEDNAIVREGMAVMLHKVGYRVVPFADGKAALEHLRAGARPDLILLDMMSPIPEGDGWRFLEERGKVAALASVPVIIVTALGIAGEEWGRSLGACGLLRKPVELEHLLEAVRHYLSGDCRTGAWCPSASTAADGSRHVR